MHLLTSPRAVMRKGGESRTTHARPVVVLRYCEERDLDKPVKGG